MTTYTKIWKAVICCFIAYIYLLSIDQGVMTEKPSMVDKVVSLGENVTLKLNETKYTSIAWLHNSSLVLLWERNTTTKNPRSNVHSQTPTCITITNAHVNDSGIYTALGFTNVGLSSTRFNLRVNTTTVN
nr:glycoprotein vIgFam3 [Elephant endotheliotropic herpesvirus 1B]